MSPWRLASGSARVRLSLPPLPPRPLKQNANMTDLCHASAAGLADGYRHDHFTPLQVLHAHLRRIEQAQPVLNAWVYVDDAGARQAAAASTARWQAGQPIGPLDGIPVTLKDNLHAAGMPTTWGSRLLAHYRPAADEQAVARLRAAGAVLLGKTNLPEFAMQGFTDNPLHGPTRNPWDSTLTPGGSSGGAVAALAAGCGTLAVGTDGGGSIRRPASHTGLLGFKPSRGQVARRGGVPELFLDFEEIGGFARDADSLIELMSVLAPGLDAQAARATPAPLRILHVPRFANHPVDGAITQAVEAAARQLRAIGHTVDHAGRFDLAERANALWGHMSAAGLSWLMRTAPAHPELGNTPPDENLIGPSLRDILAQGRALTAADLFDLLSARDALQRDLADLFGSYDLLLTPATAALPWPVGQTHPPRIDGQDVGPRGHAVFTPMANAAGLPAAAVPSGMVGHLPTGFQLIGPVGSDHRVLATARQYLSHYPWAPRWPEAPWTRP